MATILSVSATDLIRSTWGNSVATELNSNTVKIAGSTMTGSLVINAAPALRLRRSDNTPYLQFESTTGTRYSFIQGQGATVLKYNVDSASGYHSLEVADSERLRVDSAGVDVTGTFTTTGATTMNARLTIGANGNQLFLIDTSTSGSDFYDTAVSFYGGGVSIVSPGTRSGYVGYGGTSTLSLTNEVTNGGVTLTANGTGTALVTGGTVALDASTVVFSNTAERGRIAAADFMWGKTATSGATVGVEMTGAGRIMSTTSDNAYSNLYLRHNTDLDGAAFIQFVTSGGGILSHIAQDHVAPVGIYIPNCTVTAPSDYRMKNVLGPVTAPLDRLLELQPKHLAWKETGAEFDGFIAHELDTVIPDAVYGTKDGPTMQQLDMSAIIPLLVAAVQELATR